MHAYLFIYLFIKFTLFIYLNLDKVWYFEKKEK